MTAADDLRDLRDALDSIAHGALPRWGKPTTKMGEEAQVAAREVYERWVRALHHESAAKFAIAKAQVAESDHRTHAHAMTERCETVERERDEARAETQRLIELNRSHVATLCEAQRNQVEVLKAENERLQRLFDHTVQSNPGTSNAAAATQLRQQLAEAMDTIRFLQKEYGEAESSTLTRDALELKLQVMEQQRDEERKHHDALRAVWVAASDWLNHLAQNRVHYSDDSFGNLLDAVYAADARMTG